MNIVPPEASNPAATTSQTTMKKLLTIIVPAIVLAGIVGLMIALTPKASAADNGPISHTESRFCGHHCHHHGHYWNCRGGTYYCCGHGHDRSCSESTDLS